MKNIENELQYLKRSLDHYNLIGYTVHQRFTTDRRKSVGQYFILDDKGNSLTGTWNYEQIQHFIMGYGKAFNKFAQSVPA